MQTLRRSFNLSCSNREIYNSTTSNLIPTMFNGGRGSVFAYGQTGSGKTHTMNGVMDGLIESEVRMMCEERAKAILVFLSTTSLLLTLRCQIFNSETAVSFSYLELLGNDIKDCLGPADAQPVAIGEALDGRVLTRNLTNHSVATSGDLKSLVEKAKSLRSTAATTRNDTSSRSHGCGIIQCKDIETGIIGTLYIIDLAGSERAADQKNHDKAR